jgi:hypothetical protein
MAWRRSSISQKPSISRSGCAVGLNRLRMRSASVFYRLEQSSSTLAPMSAHKRFHSPARWEIRGAFTPSSQRRSRWKSSGGHRAQPFASLACDCGANDARGEWRCDYGSGNLLVLAARDGSASSPDASRPADVDQGRAGGDSRHRAVQIGGGASISSSSMLMGRKIRSWRVRRKRCVVMLRQSSWSLRLTPLPTGSKPLTA